MCVCFFFFFFSSGGGGRYGTHDRIISDTRIVLRYPRPKIKSYYVLLLGIIVFAEYLVVSIFFSIVPRLYTNTKPL